MKKSKVSKILLVMALVINVMLACYLILSIASIDQTSHENLVERSDDIVGGVTRSTDNKQENPAATETPQPPPETTEPMSGYSYYEVSQMFFGKWKITERLNLEFHNYRPSDPIPNHDAILGEEIEFAMDYVEFTGEKHAYVKSPVVCCVPLDSEDTLIGANRAKTLGITGSYYSVVVLEVPDAHQYGEPSEPYEVRINDITRLILKDNDTMFASAEEANYKLERVSDE